MSLDIYRWSTSENAGKSGAEMPFHFIYTTLIIHFIVKFIRQVNATNHSCAMR